MLFRNGVRGHFGDDRIAFAGFIGDTLHCPEVEQVAAVERTSAVVSPGTAGGSGFSFADRNCRAKFSLWVFAPAECKSWADEHLLACFLITDQNVFTAVHGQGRLDEAFLRIRNQAGLDKLAIE